VRLHHLSLTNFRNYARLELSLPARLSVFQGANAQGKTNLLESIYYLATTKSPLASSDRELLSWAAEGEPLPYARVEGAYQRGGQEHTLGATIMLEPPEAGAEQGTLRRQLRVDGVARRAMDAVGQLNVVLFLPEDILLVSGSPGERRRYLDVFLCQLDARYCRTLSAYNRVLSQRNALLKRIREGSARTNELGYWDSQIARLGAYVMARRMWAISHLDPLACEAQRALTGGQEGLRLTYEHTLRAGEALDLAFRVLGDIQLHWGTQGNEPSEDAVAKLEAYYAECLAAVRRDELNRAVTLVGPHRDDMRFVLDGYDARVYGSRGQQRTAALAIKLSETSLMRESIGDMPILLLDDVLSELDRQRGRYVLERTAEAGQVFVTTTSLDEVPGSFSAQACVWRVQAGSILPWEQLASRLPQ